MRKPTEAVRRGRGLLERLDLSVAIGTCLKKFSDRKIVARLLRRCRRQAERRMIPDYCNFTMGSAFRATGQLRTQGALAAAN
jgi:hypothetical protein